jgi:FAD/FMN-containing dehydrogenase
MSAPSLSPRHDSNPAFRVIRVRAGVALDYEQFHADIVANPREEVVWRREYGFRELYGARNLSDEALTEVAETIASDPDAMWNYREMMHAGNFNTRAFHRCMLVSVSREGLAQCLSESTEMTRF